MSLFSWFAQKSDLSTSKNSPETIQKELTAFNNTSMWPVAKARPNTVVKQHIFVNEMNHKHSHQEVTKLQKKTV
ncbi:hypothetical protein [Thalassotalea sp. PLHSN55]|uniref:hypothetical protein n=1 Tax=Thalassotalea sp. PLHSN55 TaxID=3435888 RepID=UPI003F85D60E